MKYLPQTLLVLATVFGTSLLKALAATHYVDAGSVNPTAPYSNWATAATNIQDAVDAAVAGDEVVVTNGTYATGGRDGNRVNADKPLMVRSVGGPQLTTVDGGISTRCAYLTNGATLSGFTLTNGLAVDEGGGVWCESSSAVVSNCVITGNLAYSEADGESYGGGVYQGTLNDCTLAGNSAHTYPFGSIASPLAQGGGAYGCVLSNCRLIGNSATIDGDDEHYLTLAQGGGASYCTLSNCTLSANSASATSGDFNGGDQNAEAEGGGASYCTLNNCTLSANSASATRFYRPILLGTYLYAFGGGAYQSILHNCTLIGNSAGTTDAFINYQNHATGGGAFGSTLNNSALTGNSATDFGGGDNYANCTLNYCCTSPYPGGIGNITAAPLFVDTNGWANLRLQSNSPCINAGNNAFAPTGLDLDGNPRIVGGAVDIGAYEYQSLSLINFSVVSNQAGFNITGQTNQVVVVETSPDLLNWSPLATNTLNGHPFSFSDPTPANLPRRFYRAQSQ